MVAVKGNRYEEAVKKKYGELNWRSDNESDGEEKTKGDARMKTHRSSCRK